jgi:hypothetical protein
VINRLCLAIAMFASAGCGKQGPTAADTAATPESAYRELMLAMVSGDERTIRSLIVKTDGAESLWEGEYSKEVASLLVEQYRTMDITRSENGDIGRVELSSSAFPLPLTVIKSDSSWKVDAGPIIEARRKADSFRESTQ